MVNVDRKVNDVQQRAAHQLVVLVTTDEATHDAMDLLRIPVRKLCWVALDAYAALLANGVNCTDLYQ